MQRAGVTVPSRKMLDCCRCRLQQRVRQSCTAVGSVRKGKDKYIRGALVFTSSCGQHLACQGHPVLSSAILQRTGRDFCTSTAQSPALVRQSSAARWARDAAPRLRSLRQSAPVCAARSQGAPPLAVRVRSVAAALLQKTAGPPLLHALTRPRPPGHGRGADCSLRAFISPSITWQPPRAMGALLSQYSIQHSAAASHGRIITRLADAMPPS